MTEIYIKDSNKAVMQELQTAGFNIVTCGMCGSIRLHKTGVTELDCEYCGFVSDICDFPDLYVVDQKVKSAYDMTRGQFIETLSVKTSPEKIFENAHTIYEYMGKLFNENCTDSVLREWAFQWWAECTGNSYDEIYNRWLEGDMEEL